MTSAQQPLATSPALRALAACVRGAPPDDLRRHIADALDAGADLHRVAAQHHLLSLLSIRIREAGLQSSLPDEQWAMISQEHATLAYHQAHMFAAALEVVTLFRSAGIAPVLPIKGLASAALIWPELLPRRLVDLDFLLAPDQVAGAQETLRNAGFAPLVGTFERYLLHFHAPTLIRAGVRVELHHRLWQSGRLPFESPGINGLTARSVSRTIQGQPIRVPCPEDAVILIAAVLVRDRFDVRLHQWADLYWLLARSQPGPDPSRLRSLARALRMQGLVAVLLRFMQELFECSLLPNSEPDSICAEAYDQLRPILWRRLIAGSRLSGHHAVAFDWIASRRASRVQWDEGVSPGEGAPRAVDDWPGLWSRLRSFGGPMMAAAKAGGYAGRLLTSRLSRREFREETVIRRVLRALNEAEGAEVWAGSGQ